MHRSNKQHHGGSGQLRIIGGQWRGRKLPIANIEGLRPTPDRIRETLFNWLTAYTPGAHILDCFSGSGALALEALSRGAASATLLDKATVATKTLNQNLTLLSAPHGQAINADALLWLTQPAKQTYDIIFLDPPFRQSLLEKTCHLLSTNGYVTSGSFVYIETEKELILHSLPANWKPCKEKTAGQIRYTLWEVCHSDTHYTREA